MKSRSPAGRATQRGATLITVLVLLLVMTLLGLVGIRTTLMEERMSASIFDRSLAFQAAEAALREGETAANLRPTPASPIGNCQAGLCGRPAANTEPVWKSNAVWSGAPTVSGPFNPSSSSPTVAQNDAKYIIEMLADDVPAKGSCTTSGDVSESVCTGKERRYRITARVDQSGQERSSVLLQSIYIVP